MLYRIIAYELILRLEVFWRKCFLVRLIENPFYQFLSPFVLSVKLVFILISNLPNKDHLLYGKNLFIFMRICQLQFHLMKKWYLLSLALSKKWYINGTESNLCYPFPFLSFSPLRKQQHFIVSFGIIY